MVLRSFHSGSVMAVSHCGVTPGHVGCPLRAGTVGHNLDSARLPCDLGAGVAAVAAVLNSQITRLSKAVEQLGLPSFQSARLLTQKSLGRRCEPSRLVGIRPPLQEAGLVSERACDPGSRLSPGRPSVSPV